MIESLDAKKQLGIDKFAFLLLIFLIARGIRYGHVTTRGKISTRMTG